MIMGLGFVVMIIIMAMVVVVIAVMVMVIMVLGYDGIWNGVKFIGTGMPGLAGAQCLLLMHIFGTKRYIRRADAARSKVTMTCCTDRRILMPAAAAAAATHCAPEIDGPFLHISPIKAKPFLLLVLSRLMQ